jgi:hypothetical protein
MNPTAFKNRLNNDRVICNDTRLIEVIEGVEFIVVHRPGSDRQFLMRKDTLVKDTTVVKGISRNFAKV